MSRFMDWEAVRLASSYGEMASWPFAKLEDVAFNPFYRQPQHSVTRAVAVMEMTYRAFGPLQDANELIWQVVFGDDRPTPIGARAPSQAWPKLAKQRLKAGIL